MGASAEPLLETRPVRALREAAGAGRLGQSLLLYGPDLARLEQVALHLSDVLLATPGYRPAAGQHADHLTLRPAGKMRQIKVGESASDGNTVRAFLHAIALAPVVGPRKVAVVHEADCFNAASANAFLKTLEEPPRGTTILLLTTRPHALLPTIRSRCLHFFVPAPGDGPLPEALASWRTEYTAWLRRVAAGGTGKAAVADAVMGACALTARAATALEQLGEAQAGAAGTLEGLEDDEAAALIEGLAVGWRARFLREVAGATRDFARERLPADAGGETRRRLAAAIDQLEEVARLLRYNLPTAAALENFLLSAMRIWYRSPE